MRRADFEGPPCHCPECLQAGVSDKPLRRDPRKGDWMHGYRLKTYYEAQDKFWQRVRAIDDRKTGQEQP